MVSSNYIEDDYDFDDFEQEIKQLGLGKEDSKEKPTVTVTTPITINDAELDFAELEPAPDKGTYDNSIENEIKDLKLTARNDAPLQYELDAK